MNIPEEALTAAQDAYWEGVEEARERGIESVGHYLGVKAALSAAAPTLMAMAWEEGKLRGKEIAAWAIGDASEDHRPDEANPYKEQS